MNKFTKNFLTVSISFLLVFTFAGVANAQNFGIINSNGYGSGYGNNGYSGMDYGSSYGMLGMGFNSGYGQGGNFGIVNAGLGFGYNSGYGSNYGLNYNGFGSRYGNEVVYSPIYSGYTGYGGYQPNNYFGGYGTLSPGYQPYNGYYGSNTGYGYGSAPVTNSYQNINAGYSGGFYW